MCGVPVPFILLSSDIRSEGSIAIVKKFIQKSIISTYLFLLSSDFRSEGIIAIVKKFDFDFFL